ncbi:MAG: helix-turn-helix transcriptional regulator [Thermodesulfovibrionales bacterium]|nr:helix-turn-helix transcriptional regulator [Thermodesulfovibrionales bacterium]MDP3112719.1 helix-turn-helix transcriptional regulator [Thermodesulfovibrionales bacterium]
MSNIKKVFGKNIRSYREAKNLSQEQFADLCGLHRTYISHVECGKRNVSIENIQKIAQALRVKISDLFIGVNAKKNK